MPLLYSVPMSSGLSIVEATRWQMDRLSVEVFGKYGHPTLLSDYWTELFSNSGTYLVSVLLVAPSEGEPSPVWSIGF